MEKVTVDSVIKIIQELKQEAKANGKDSIEITSKQLHDIIGKYPNGNTRYPTCCRAMYKSMSDKDVVLNSTKSTYSSTIKIKYFI